MMMINMYVFQFKKYFTLHKTNESNQQQVSPEGGGSSFIKVKSILSRVLRDSRGCK